MKNGFSDRTIASEAGKKSSNKGQKQRKTIIKEALQDRIGDFDKNLYDLSQEFLNDPEKQGFAWKELIKYRLVQKTSSDLKVSGNIGIKVDKFID